MTSFILTPDIRTVLPMHFCKT